MERSYEIKPRSSNEITLHSLILNNTENDVLEHIERLVQNERSFILTEWPERLYMSISGSSIRAKSFKYNLPNMGYEAEFFAMPLESIYEINSEFQSTLHLAAGRGMPRVVTRLIELNIDINARDGAGRTALHHAVLFSDMDIAINIIEQLARAGIDLDTRDLSLQTARHLALHSDAFSEETLRKLTNTQVLEQYKVEKDGVRKLRSEIAQEEGKLNEARKLEFEETLVRIKLEVDLSQNSWGREYWRNLENTGQLLYTLTKKNVDKQHLERAISILTQIINVANEVEANLHNIKQALHYLCSMISELSKETKGGYQEILWPEIEYLQNLLINLGDSNPRNQVAQLLLREILPDLIKNDFVFLCEQFHQMINEHDQWEGKNKNASSDRTPTVSIELFNLHCFVRYFHDLESLGSIIQLSEIASRLDLSDPLQRRELFLITRKIGDTSKYEFLGTNLSIAVKSMLPNVPWDDLHKLRNTLKEAVQKFPERRKLIKKFVTEGDIEGLDLEGLRSDVVVLGQRLSEVQNILMNLGYNSAGIRTTSVYLDAIKNFYAFEKGLSEVGTYTVISEQNKIYLLQILEKYYNEDFKQRSEVIRIIQELEGTIKQIQGITGNQKMSVDKKAQLLLGKNEKQKKLEAELNEHKQKARASTRPFIDKIHDNITLTKTDRAKLKQLLNGEQYKEFILTYFKGVLFSSFGLFDEVLSIGKEESFNDRTPDIQMQYLYFARIEEAKIFETLIPDEVMRNNILANIKLDRYHLNKVNPESTYFHQKLMEYINNPEFCVKLNTIIIDFVLYLINSGVQYNMKMRNIMEHFDALHKNFDFASKLEIFKELLSFLTDVEQQIEDRDLELQAKGIAPVTQDIDETYVFDSAQRFAAISKILNAHSNKFKFFKKYTNQSEQHSASILPINGDGDCMYNSILEGLRRLPDGTNTNIILPNGTNIDMRTINLAQLRGMIADHIEANQGHYFDLIAYQIADNIRANELAGYPVSMRVQMQALATAYRLNMQATEQYIQQFINGGIVGQYMNLMRNTYGSGQEVVWGGGVELGVLSTLLGTQFYVYRRGGEYYHIDLTNHATALRIDLDYTGNHYNLVLLPTMLGGSNQVAGESLELPQFKLIEERILQQYQDGKLSKDCTDANIKVNIKVNIKGIEKVDFESYCKSQLGISMADLEFDGTECWISLDKKSIAILQEKLNTQSFNDEDEKKMSGEGSLKLQPEYHKLSPIDPFYNRYYKYGLDEMLVFRLKDANLQDIATLPAFKLNIYTLQTTLSQITKKIDEGFDKVIIPCNIEGKHWIGFLFQKTVDSLKILYLDSEHGKLAVSFKNQFIEYFQGEYQEVLMIEEVVERQKYNNCGPEVIENFIKYLGKERLPQDEAVYYHSQLLEQSLLSLSMKRFLDYDDYIMTTVPSVSYDILMLCQTSVSHKQSTPVDLLPLIKDVSLEEIHLNTELSLQITNQASSDNTGSIPNIGTNFIKRLNDYVEHYLKKIFLPNEFYEMQQLANKHKVDIEIVDEVTLKQAYKKIALKTHPDKYLDATEDFIKAKQLLEQKSPISTELYTPIDSIRAFKDPSLENVLKVSTGCIHLVSMYTGKTGVMLPIAVAGSAYQAYQGDYWEAATSMTKAIGFTLMFSTIYTTAPAVAVVLSAGFTGYATYSMLNNGYELIMSNSINNIDLDYDT